MNLNKLLEKQIKKYLPENIFNQQQVQGFINAINSSYNSYERDQMLSSHAFKISEQEYAAVNEQLKLENEIKRQGVKNLQEAIRNVQGNAGDTIPIDIKEDNLLDTFDYLNEQIDKRKTVERELKNSEYHLSTAANRLSQLISNLHNGILLEDENRTIILTNQLFCDMFSIPLDPGAMTGMSCKDSAEQSKHLFKHPGKFIAGVEALLQNRQPVIGDELEMSNGTVLMRDYVPIFVANEYKGHLWKYVDITKEKETQNELKRLSLVASANENGVAFCDAVGVITWANEGITKLTGYSREEAIGKKAVELCLGPLSDMNTVKIILDAFYNGKGFNVEVIHYRKDKSWFWGRLKGQSILDERGNVHQYFAMIEDITIEKEKEEQLRVLSLIAEDNINTVIIADAHGCISWVNKSFAKTTGYSLEEVKGKKVDLMNGPDTSSDTIAYLVEQTTAGNPVNCELLNYHKNGTTYWVRILGQAIRNEQGELTGYFSMEEDISREREDQLKLKEYESRFRKAFEKIGDNVWEHDFSTGKTYFSNTRSHLLGYGFDDFTANADLWWSRTHRDDLALLEQNDQKYRNGEIDHHILEYRVIHKDGSTRWVMDRGVVIELGKDGKPAKIIGTHTDITERKQAEVLLQREEQKYRSIIANMNLGLLEVDTDEKVIFTNQRFCEMSGYDYEELIGRKASHIYVKGENIELIESKNEARKRASSLDAYEIAVKNKRGQLRWWLISGALRYNDAGELVGSIGIHLDITEQKQLEIDLIEAREQAEQSTRSKEIFLANMSHEIRTPMNAIFGMTNQLTKTKLDSMQRFYLDTINSASENLLVIINDILDLSKIEAGMLNLENIPFEPKSVISRAMQVLMHKAEEKGLSITNSTLDAGLSPVLMGDPYRLNQVLLNLMSNAIKFTEKGCVDLSCTLLQDTAATQTVQIEVNDTGIGMDDMFVYSLFEKFSQEDVSVTRQYGGTGLGMSISKDLIELMGGKISVKSKKGVGTSVSFNVEFAKGRIEDLPSKETFSINKDMLVDKKILVVDDNNMNRLVAKTILKNYGAVITEAINGKDAVDLIQQHEFDLVLMDIQMPVMGGMEATKIIREEISVSLPVIALTANAIKGDNEKCIEGGMNAYLSKPFKEEDLLKIVSFWTGTVGEGNFASKSILARSTDKLYDLSAIRTISRGNEMFVIKMVNMLIDQVPVQVAQMEARYDEGDYKGMAAIAHKIKPGIDNMGIVSLKESIREIEKIGKTGIANDALGYLLKTVSKNLNKVIEALQMEFDGAAGKLV
ncbi:MAG: luxQ 5 [Ferruginibacter sp.]|nr:luxQ 5 [Ferruginibacter sp.]